MNGSIVRDTGQTENIVERRMEKMRIEKDDPERSSGGGAS